MFVCVACNPCTLQFSVRLDFFLASIATTATGLPALTVPAGFNTDGVPVGIEFLGRRFAEATVLKLAYAFEQAYPHRRLPPSAPALGVEVLSY